MSNASGVWNIVGWKDFRESWSLVFESLWEFGKEEQYLNWFIEIVKYTKNDFIMDE